MLPADRRFSVCLGTFAVSTCAVMLFILTAPKWASANLAACKPIAGAIAGQATGGSTGDTFPGVALSAAPGLCTLEAACQLAAIILLAALSVVGLWTIYQRVALVWWPHAAHHQGPWPLGAAVLAGIVMFGVQASIAQ